MILHEDIITEPREEPINLPKESLNYVDRLRARELTNIELKKLEDIDDEI